MSDDRTPDVDALRENVRSQYREVAINPHGSFRFHTDRPLAVHLGYEMRLVDALPDRAVESFAGVANPLLGRAPEAGERVVDLGSGAGFNTFIAAQAVGPSGRVIGVDMTDEMLAKARGTAAFLGLEHVEFREGLIEDLPVESEWADVVISNGVINLCADKRTVFSEIHRVLRPGGRLQFADIANGQLMPDAMVQNVDLWTAWIAGGLPCAAWKKMMEEVGFVDVFVGPPVDTFQRAGGEKNARRFEVYGYTFMAHKMG